MSVAVRASSRSLPVHRTLSLWCGNVLFDAESLCPGTVVVENGLIAHCFPGQASNTARRVAVSKNWDFIDLGPTSVLSPGLIDVHTHISELGRDWEGYSTATRAAAAGGITTLMSMPLNSLPSTTTVAAVEQELATAQHTTLMADVGLWGGVVPENIENQEELEALLRHSAVFGLKAFLAPLPPSAGYQAVTPEQLGKAAEICGRHGKPILVHSELMTEKEAQQAAGDAFAQYGSPSSYQAHLHSRPPRWERDAVEVVCSLIDRCDMHIVHLSDADCLSIIARAKATTTSHRLTVETCPHYLLFAAEEIPDGDTRYKCFPPIREKRNQKKLKEALRDGLIDMVASDHSPCNARLRLRQEADMQRAWGGLTGLQYQLPATFDAMGRVKTMAKWWSHNPARLVPGLHGIKGSIAVGKQADLCAWDPGHSGPPASYSKEYHRWKGDSLYADMDLRGRVLRTWLRGCQVYNGETDSFPHESFFVGSMLTCASND